MASSGGGTATLGLDASKYIAALSQVSQANQSANQTLQQLMQTINRFNSASAQMNGVTVQLSGGLGAINAQLAVLSGAAAAQSVYRLYQQFAAATKEAGDFSRSIGLIQTITADANLSYEQWANGIRKVSDALGTPLLETSAAAYDLLSNQVGKAADTFQTLTVSGNLAKLTNSSVTDSVNTLSSVINAYGYSAGSAEELSAKLFTTVDLGRVKLNEVANTAGRVYETGKSLGVGFEEINASLIAITQTGVKTNTAMTLIVNVLQKLLKPTKELQELYNELGVGTGDVFVKTYGFMGALQKLSEVTKGSTAEVSKFFNEIRGKQGFDILIDQQKAYAKGLEEQTNGLGRFKAALDVYEDTPGFKLQKEATQLQNELTTSLKTEMLEAVLQVSEAFGGLKNTMVELLRIAGLVGGGIAGWQVAMAASQVTAAGLAATLSGVGIPAAAFVAGAALTNEVIKYQSRMEEARNMHALLLESQKQLSQQEQASNDKVTASDLENTKKILQEKVRAQLSFQNSLRQSLGKVGDQLDSVLDKTMGKVRNTVELILGSARDALRDLDSRLSKATGNVQGSAQSRRDLRSERDEALFNFQLARDRATTGGANEGQIAQDRLDQLRRQMNAAVKAGDKDEYEKLHGKAAGILNDLATATNPDGSLKYSGQEDTLRAFYAQADKDQARIKEVNQKQAEALAKQKSELSAQVKALEDAGKDLYTFSLTDTKGNLQYGSKEEAQGEFQKRVEDYRAKLETVRKNPNAADNFRGVVNEQILAERTKQFNESVSQAFGTVGDKAAQLTAVGRINAAGDQIAHTLAEINKKIQDAAANMTEAEGKYGEARSRTRATLGTLLAEGGDTGTFFSHLGQQARDEAFGHLETRVKAVNEAADKGDFAGARAATNRVEDFLRNLGVFATESMTGGRKNANGDLLFKTPKAVLDQVRQELGTQEQAAGEQFRARREFVQLDQQIPETVDRLNEALAGLNQAARSTDISKLTSAGEAFAEMVQRVGQSVQVIEAMGRGERAVRELGPPESNESHGGFAGYFSEGGETRGIDSMLARVDPREFIMNPQASARFHSTLIAMNQGWGAPVGAGAGSTVNGGIHVTVQGGSTSQQTVQEIAAGINRAIHRGTIRIGR
jgi:TP901 family phage tail tape measure protein